MRHIKFITEALLYFCNLALAFVIVAIIRLFKNRKESNIWVIGGNGGDYYSDNSAELFNYILRNYPKLEVYWIIKKSSNDVSKVKGPVLFKHSLKGNIYVMLAKVLICNHSIRGDILRADMKLFKESFTVNLCHGVTAFKEKKSFGNFDMVIATSDYEKEIKSGWMNNNKEKIVVSGFPRYDTLYKKKNESIESNKILYMPTWRPWLTKKWIDPSEEDFNDFKKTNFYNEVNSFLNNDNLYELLKDNGYQLNVFFHKNLHLFIREIIVDEHFSNIKLLPNNTNVQEQLLSSSLLITDYSSVAWDFLFLDRPVLFYQFDYETYKKYNNSYISMPEELFGPVTSDYKNTIKLIDNFMNSNLDNDLNKSIIMKDKFIKHNDTKNSERVMQAILDRI